jgi:poly(3-hydroxybutyrate) depolymerase
MNVRLMCVVLPVSLGIVACGGDERVREPGTGTTRTDGGVADSGTSDAGQVLTDAGTPPQDGGSTGDAGSTQDAGTIQDAGTARVAPTYNGVCPNFAAGRNQAFESGGFQREFLLELPPEPNGAPVVFAWHWLGGNAQQIMFGLGASGLAQAEGAIIIAPESHESQFEWRFAQGPSNNPDLQLFEDLLACLSEQYDVDLSRIHSAGHSAGGLWTSYLTMHASEWLASTVAMSGGTDAQTYATPTHQIPVLIVWGGPSDNYGGFNFATASELFSQKLLEDGHFVAQCVHDGGHTPPPNPGALMWNWFEAHPADLEIEPYLSGLPASYPSFCSIPE